MTTRKKAIIFGVHSFVDYHVKVGIQFIAEGLASQGWTVDYISLFSSFFDLARASRRQRFKRIWLNRQDKYGIKIKPGLTEYAFRAFFPAHKLLLRHPLQIKTFPWLLPSWIRKQKYDICINDITANVVYFPIVQSKLNILRLNDLPEGFRYALSMQIITMLKNLIRTNTYDDIWSAHEPLTQYVLKLNKNNNAVTIHNGVDDSFLALRNPIETEPRSAVYIGSIEKWVDLELLDKTAAILTDWTFDVIGPMNRSWPIRSKNIRWVPPINRQMVPEILSRYKVGLVPFRDIEQRLKFVEKPLKFYEYIGAGLGVASTNVGSLKAGMGDWASYGNTPASFARAIKEAAISSDTRSPESCHELVKKHSWSRIMHTIDSRLKTLTNLPKN